MKQYVPKKPIRRGFKVWVLADGRNGFFVDMEVYVGKASDGVTTEHGLGERVVLQLTEEFRNLNHWVFCDNFFTSPRLFEELLSHHIYACGTVRCDRLGFPEVLRGLSLERGKHKFQQRGNLTALVWQDKRQVNVLSTLHNPDDVASVRRKEKNGSQTTLNCPTAITTYNQYMGGVDRGDQLRHYYQLRLKSTKNYKYLFWFIVDVAITNAYILHHYTVLTPSSCEQQRLKWFRLQLAEALIGDYNSRQKIGRPRSSTAHPQPIPVPQHFPTKSEVKRRCVYCQTCRSPPCRRESRWHCADCEGSPSLCLTGSADSQDCWRLWHAM